MNCTRNDKLDFLLSMASHSIAEKLLEEYDNIDTSDIVFDDYYKKKKRKIIRHERIQPIIKGAKKILSRVAVIFLVIISAAFITIMSVSAIREAVWSFIVEKYENYVTIRFVQAETDNEALRSDVSKDNAIQTENKSALKAPIAIEEYKKPSYLPFGFVEDIVFKNQSAFAVDYYSENKWVCSYYQVLFTDDEKYFDNSSVNIENVKVGGYKGVLITHEDSTMKSLYWHDEKYTYTLTVSSMDSKTLISVAESVRKVEDALESAE